MSSGDDKYIIRTSDRINFKSCRQAWNYGSKLRRNMEPVRLPAPLDFGTAVHAGLQTYYDPNTWSWDRDLVQTAALSAFGRTNWNGLTRYEELRGPDELLRIEFIEREKLGLGMLKNYFAYSREHDKFTPMYVEVEFEVPIPVPPGLSLPSGFSRDENGDLTKLNEDLDYVPVVYQGRIDLVIIDEHGNYWIDDHKTAGQIRADVLAHLEMDEQMKSYVWAIQKQLGVKVKGVIYNELYKGIPEPPAMNKVQRKGRWYSVNMSQDTSYDLYKKTVMEEDTAAYEAGLYDTMLAFLLNQGNKYFRRSSVMYNDFELEFLGHQICLEAIDMLSNPLIYPNPSRFKCGYCMFRAPCLANMDGSDESFVLNEMYTNRDTPVGSPYIKEPQEDETIVTS